MGAGVGDVTSGSREVCVMDFGRSMLPGTSVVGAPKVVDDVGDCRPAVREL